MFAMQTQFRDGPIAACSTPCKYSAKLQLFSVAESLERMASTLPKSDLNDMKELLKSNKKLAKMTGHISEMSDDDPHRGENLKI